MKKKTQKPVVGKENEEQSKIELDIQKQSIIDSIFEQAEELKIKPLDRQKKEDIEKILGKSESLSISEVEQYVINSSQKHPPQFYLEFYEEAYRILGIVDKDPKDYIKPRVIADITNETVYGRFDKTVLPSLQQLNKYKGYCLRVDRHYQFLNKEGIKLLQQYIHDAKEVMKTCTTYYDFRKKMGVQYGIPYQAEFEFKA